MYRIVLSWIVILLGVAFAGAGAYLIVLGGSWYYVAAGIALAASGWALFTRKQWGLSTFGLVLLGTLVWSLWEVGLDWWALSARGTVLIGIGALLLLPPMVRSLHTPDVGWARTG